MIDLLPDLGPHGSFIWAAYAAFFLVIAALTAWIMADVNRQQRLLEELERQGVRRRSATAKAAPATPPAGKPAGAGKAAGKS